MYYIDMVMTGEKKVERGVARGVPFGVLDHSTGNPRGDVWGGALCVFHALSGLGQPFGQRGRPGRHSSATFGQSRLIPPLHTSLSLYTKLSKELGVRSIGARLRVVHAVGAA